MLGSIFLFKAWDFLFEIHNIASSNIQRWFIDWFLNPVFHFLNAFFQVLIPLLKFFIYILEHFIFNKHLLKVEILLLSVHLTSWCGWLQGVGDIQWSTMWTVHLTYWCCLLQGAGDIQRSTIWSVHLTSWFGCLQEVGDTCWSTIWSVIPLLCTLLALSCTAHGIPHRLLNPKGALLVV